MEINKKNFLSLVGFVSILFLTVACTEGSDSTGTFASLEAENSEGGGSAGTEIPGSDASVKFSDIEAGPAEKGQVLSTDGEGNLLWTHSLPFLEITGHMDASGLEPEIKFNATWCPGETNRAKEGSNSVKGVLFISGDDEMCNFRWAEGTEYKSQPLCVVSQAGGQDRVPIMVQASTHGITIYKDTTDSSVTINYICLGR